MFDTLDYDALSQDLDCYQVPMFAAERRNKDQPFHILGVNQAHTRATGLRTSEIRNMRPIDFLDKKEGEQVEQHYSRCVDSGRVTQYKEELHFHGRLTRWETTLLPLKLHNGTHRVIGTALTLGVPAVSETISDVEFYAAQAQMSLGKINHFLDMLQDREDLPDDLRQSTMMIAGLNRSVEYLLNDLRLATQSEPTQRAVTPAKLRIVS